MLTGTPEPRAAKGTTLIDLVKTLRHARHRAPLPPLSARGEALLSERIFVNRWYPHDGFIALIELAFVELCRESEAKAYEMGMAGGRSQLLGPHKALLDSRDPASSVLAMRHAWRLNFNFGELRAEAEAPRRTTFRLLGYADVTPAHGYMIAGWAAAAAQLAGSTAAGAVVLEAPWSGSRELVYRVDF